MRLCRGQIQPEKKECEDMACAEGGLLPPLPCALGQHGIEDVNLHFPVEGLVLLLFDKFGVLE